MSIRVSNRGDLATAPHTLDQGGRPRIVPASFEFCLANSKRDAHPSGTLHPFGQLRREAQPGQQLEGLNRSAAGPGPLPERAAEGFLSPEQQHPYHGDT